MRFLLAIFVLVLCGCRPQASSVSADNSPSPRIPETVSLRGDWQPHFVDVDHHELSPFESDENQPPAQAVVLVFVLQDCPIANSYMPELNRLHEKFTLRGIRMIIVDTDPKITPEAARKHAEEYQIHLPVVIDADHALVHITGATKTPEAVVILRNGEIAYDGRIDDQYVALGKRRMQVTSHDLQDALEAILAGKTIAQTKTEAIGCFIPDLPHEGK